MSSDNSQRTALITLLGHRLARGQAIKTVLFQQALADRLGLNMTDLLCLSFLRDTEAVTAGHLAEATGLTTGSVTIMIDRLEAAGYVQREKDSADRRRVLVRPQTEHIERDITPFYAALGAAWEHTLERYTLQELAVILDLLTRSSVLLQEQTSALRQEAAQTTPASDRQRAAPSAQAESIGSQGRLVFANGAYRVTLRGAALSELYEARFESPKPHIQVKADTIHIHYPRFSFFQRRRGGTITLNTAAAWQIDVRAGISTCTLDLRDLTLSGISVIDGAYQLELLLVQPRGVVPIHILGGATDITIRRPQKVATQLTVTSGSTHLRLDARSADWVTQAICWQTPNYDTASDRYDITVEGGASRLSVIN